MWYNLAAAQGDKVGAQWRDELAANMTPAQIAEAQRLARGRETDASSPLLRRSPTLTRRRLSGTQ
jgi:hypothetical protein